MEDAIKQQLDHGSTYTASKPCDEVLAELRALGQLDKTTERLRSGFASSRRLVARRGIHLFLSGVSDVWVNVGFSHTRVDLWHQSIGSTKQPN